MSGPSTRGDAKLAVLGDEGQPALYATSLDDQFRWYRYLFLGRGKPSTHIRILGNLYFADLQSGVPADLVALLNHVSTNLFGEPEG
jgi:putative ATP-dependent endonuclease of the OLD family